MSAALGCIRLGYVSPAGAVSLKIFKPWIKAVVNFVNLLVADLLYAASEVYVVRLLLSGTMCEYEMVKRCKDKLHKIRNIKTIMQIVSLKIKSVMRLQ